MTCILAADLLIADVIVALEGNPKLGALAQKYRMFPGSKVTLDDTGLHDFTAAIKHCPKEIVAGGSSANMLTTLCKLLPGRIEAAFLGVAGQGAYSAVIRDSLAEAGIVLLSEPDGGLPAISFVIMGADGQCAIATHPGNARALLTPDMITEALLHGSDIVLVQGSLWHKFGRAFVDRLVNLAKTSGRALWLTLPTQGNLTAPDASHFKALLPQADMVFGNEAELLRVFGGTLEGALNSLSYFKATNFITLGKDGAAIVSGDTVEKIPSGQIKINEIINTLGAGDTSYAGFAAGIVCGLSSHDSAHIAMMLAAEKLRLNNPRLPNPLEALRHAGIGSLPNMT